MKVVQKYSYKNSEEFFKKYHSKELSEVLFAIEHVDAVSCLIKISEEKTMKGKLLFSPIALNNQIKQYLYKFDWVEHGKSKKEFKRPRLYFGRNRFREMDGIKNKVGLEIQFGKYAFMGYDIFSKMVIFKNKRKIDCGIEVVATQELVKKMSTGVSGFEQIVIDFENRGEANIDIPVLVLGLGLTDKERAESDRRIKMFSEKPKLIFKTGKIIKANSKTRPGPKPAKIT